MADAQELERRQAMEAVLESTAAQRVVVGGPGTGKTSLFKQAFMRAAQLGGTSQVTGLALTFIKALAEDMQRDFEKSVPEVRVFTFHGYCTHLMSSAFADEPEVYGLLPAVMSDDLRRRGRLRVTEQQVKRAYHGLDDTDGLLSECVRVGEYYGAVSTEGCVHRILRLLAESPERVRTFPLIVVDEYQDLSALEIEALSLLCRGSKTLFAGDDDQALYGFKPATQEYLRALWRESEGARFTLPYCSRCTQVVVEAVNDVAREGASQLGARIEKPFRSFLSQTTRSKAADSARYPEIIHAVIPGGVSMREALGKYLVGRVNEVSIEDIEESHSAYYPTVLVVGVQPFLDWAAKSLQDAFPWTNMPRPQWTIDPIEGYRLIEKDPTSRLGWRILLHCYYNMEADERLGDAVRAGSDLPDVIPLAYRDDHLRVASLVGRVRRRAILTTGERRELWRRLFPFPAALDWLERKGAADALADADDGGELTGSLGEDEPTRPAVWCRTIIGSKGLSGGHVFVVGMCNGYMPANPETVTAEEDRLLMVALSRTRKQCHLVSFEGNGFRSSPKEGLAACAPVRQAQRAEAQS